MQAASDKTFHLKWNNHLQNLSQLFTAIYSSSALADVTLACRDGTLRAHKLVLSACSPYFEQIFKDNPCKHPVVILKGIPFTEINLLVEFMYKGSVDVQEMDLQSLMHTASELEIRGLAYEVRANAAQLLNVNLEYPAYTAPAVSVASSSYEAPARAAHRTDMERLKQIHLYQQSMLRDAERRRRREEPTPPATTAAVKSILAAAAKELADGSTDQTTSCVQTEEGEAGTGSSGMKTELFHAEEEAWSRPAKKRVSIFTPEEEKLRRKRLQYEIRESPQRDPADGGISKLRISAVTGAEPRAAETPTSSGGGIKVVQLSALQHQAPSDQNSDDEDASPGLLRERGGGGVGADDDDSYSSESASESAHDSVRDSRPHVCDICDIRFQRASHLNRHRLTHTGERPFTCGGCGKSFARSDKLRVHTKICERDDPTVDMAEDGKMDATGEVTPGTVRITHRDSRQLMFTPGGDVMLAPRAHVPPAAPLAAAAGAASTPDDTPAKRGRGRPKKPVPDVPKIKKRRGRPPKALSGMVPSPPREMLLSYHYLLGNAHPRRQSQMTAMTKLQKLLIKRIAKKALAKKNLFNNDLSPAENGPVKAKRGRKPKNREMEIEVNNLSNVDNGTPAKAKRGRKPNNRILGSKLNESFNLENGPVKAKRGRKPNNIVMENKVDNLSNAENEPVKAKRGRKPKNIVIENEVNELSNFENRLVKAKRGRKSKNIVMENEADNLSIGENEPVKAKRGRKPKNKILENKFNELSNFKNQPVKVKRGRKPKNIILESKVNQVETIKSKRGRKPKNRLLVSRTVSTRVKVIPRQLKILMKAKRKCNNGKKNVNSNTDKRFVKNVAQTIKNRLQLENSCVVQLERDCIVESKLEAGATLEVSRKRRFSHADEELDMMMGLGNGVSPALAAARFPFEGAGSGVGVGGGGGTVPMQQHITPSGQQLIVKRKRGRPPKNYFQPLPGGRLPDGYYDGGYPRTFRQYGRPNENYNATNLPFGDFSYLTEMMNYPGGLAYPPVAAPAPHPFHTVTAVDPERDVDMDTTADPDSSAAAHSDKKTPIDLSSSSSDEGTEDSRAEPDDTVPAAVCETEIMTVGDCQILKLPPSEDPKTDPPESVSENGNLSITAIPAIGDCTVRPLDGNA